MLGLHSYQLPCTPLVGGSPSILPPIDIESDSVELCEPWYVATAVGLVIILSSMSLLLRNSSDEDLGSRLQSVQDSTSPQPLPYL